MHTVPYIPLTMIRKDLDNLPSFSCPDGFALRYFRPGEQHHWARIEHLADEFPDEGQALYHFEEEFGNHLESMAERCFFLVNARDEPIGTATAWYGELNGEAYGRVHWVAIEPEYQGRKLAKPLLSAVLARLARDHQRALLDTQTTSYRAVNLYLDFGFEPYPVRDSCREGWELMEQVLKRKIL